MDLVSQTPRPRGRGRPLFADLQKFTNFTRSSLKKSLLPGDTSTCSSQPLWRNLNLLTKGGKVVEIGVGAVLRSVALYCAMSRDYLSDTPLLRAMGFFGRLNMTNWVRYPLPLVRAFPSWRACFCGGAIPPPPFLHKRGISAILARCRT